MFSFVYPEAANGLAVLRQRILQAGAAKIPQVLTFGHTKGNNRAIWLKVFKELAPLAADQNVTLVIKQHGGDTGSGVACAALTTELAHPNIKVNYDAGNVMDYLQIDPLKDLAQCVAEVRSFCIKDHRNTPKKEDCGPGWGEIDHFKLLKLVANTGLTMPLCCENIWEPGVPRPTDGRAIDKLAQRAREYMEKIIAQVQAAP
jgi:sugar phosphate isomerase/epimerase